MKWVRLDTLPSNLSLGTCADPMINCPTQTGCYALVYTPTFVDANSGTTSSQNSLEFNSYTSFFRIDCSPSNIHSITINESCIMTDNSSETQICPAIEQRFNASGNNGSNNVILGESYVIHLVCAESGAELEIREPPSSPVQSSASLGVGATAITENLDVANVISECNPLPPTVTIGAEVENGDVFIDNSNGLVLKDVNGQCYRLTIDAAGELVSLIVTCPN